MKLFIPILSVVLLVSIALLSAGVLSAPIPEECFSGGSPSGLCTMGENVLIADTYNKLIWRLTGSHAAVYAGQSATADLYGQPSAAYYDGKRLTAYFGSPCAISPFLEGYAVCDSMNNVIRYVDDEAVRTAAGTSLPGSKDGRGTLASFNAPAGLATDEAGLLYIADTGNNSIRKMDLDGNVTTLIGPEDGLLEPTGLCWHGGALYIADSGNHRVCRWSGDVLTVLAGGIEGQSGEDGAYDGGYIDGAANIARFSSPQALAVAENGDVYIADTGNGALRLLRDGTVSTLLPPAEGSESLWPVSPCALLLKGEYLYVADSFAFCVLALPLSTLTATGK